MAQPRAHGPDAIQRLPGPLIEKRMGADAGPTDTRFSEDELLQRELSMSNMQNKLQMMLDATLSDIERYPLRCANLMVIDIDRYCRK